MKRWFNLVERQRDMKGEAKRARNYYYIYDALHVYFHWRSVGLDFATNSSQFNVSTVPRVDSCVVCAQIFHSRLLILLKSHDFVISRHINLMLTRSQQQPVAPACSAVTCKSHSGGATLLRAALSLYACSTFDWTSCVPLTKGIFTKCLYVCVTNIANIVDDVCCMTLGCIHERKVKFSRPFIRSVASQQPLISQCLLTVVDNRCFSVLFTFNSYVCNFVCVELLKYVSQVCWYIERRLSALFD